MSTAPTPDTFHRNPSTVRWGILGAGQIATKFVAAARAVPNCEVLAVASRSPDKAHAFAKANKIPGGGMDYAELLGRSDIDAIYVATTHNFHKECMTAALASGKAVLCEKPFTVNALEAREVVQLATNRRLFLMEAMWTRFLPAMRQAIAWLEAGKIGDIREIQAQFCFDKPYDPENRIFNPDLAGGALLDVGIYPISFASMVMGRAPDQISSAWIPAPSGVDAHETLAFTYGSETIAILGAGTRLQTSNRAEIIGSRGRILFPDNFFSASAVELQRADGRMVSRKKFPVGRGNGFKYQIAEAVQQIRAGGFESPLLPLAETIAIMETLDQIRAQWGLKYPFEKP